MKKKSSAAAKTLPKKTVRKPGPGAAAEVDAYIAPFPAKVRAVLKKVRATIRRAAPDAEEVISYQMPAFKQQGMLVLQAGCSAIIITGVYQRHRQRQFSVAYPGTLHRGKQIITLASLW